MFQNRFDELYLTVCKQVGGIQGLLKSFFDFMIRKTDFFYECDPGDKMGFPPGYSKALLNKIFEDFQNQHYKRFPRKSVKDFEQKMKAFKGKQQQIKKIKQKPTNKKQQTKLQETIEENCQKNEKPISQAKEQEKQKVQSVKQQKGQPIINTYNGGTNEKYSWSQQSNDVQVTIEIDNEINKNNIKVVIKSQRISIRRNDQENSIIIEGQLYEKINSTESVWKIQRSKGKSFIILNLEKAQDKIWSTVFKGDAQIDTTKVNNTKPLKQFDQQTQGAIRKIMYEQQRKMQGLPTTDQEKQLQALKKAWDADGSPFKGQPFDPSKFNLQGSQFNPQGFK